MANQPTIIDAKGRYFWELIFSYDNRENTASKIERVIRKETERKVNSRVFMSEKLQVSTGFRLGNETNASMTFKGVVDVESSSSFSFHVDTALELEKTSETTTVIDEKDFFEETFVVEAGDSLAAYRLCYITDGVFLSTNIVHVASVDSEPPDDIFVDLQFAADLRLLGYPEIAETLRDTRPRQDNKGEWNDIRETVLASTSKSQFDAFKDLVERLHQTRPRRDNKEEWGRIRKTCQQIIDDWDSAEKQLLLLKLLQRFYTTHPRRDNKEEWAKIRDVSKGIIEGIERFF